MLVQFEATPAKPKPRELFYSYAHKDESLRDDLAAHLTILKRDGFISEWHDRKIRPGHEWKKVIDDRINTADIILFLISPNFIASDYCMGVEVKRAMERHRNGEASVVPIILRTCPWMREEFGILEPLPKTGRPLSDWPDAGFAHVAEELRLLLLEFNYPQTPVPGGNGFHGQWILKAKDDGQLIEKAARDAVIDKLKDITTDYSIALIATARTQVVAGEKLAGDTMLILSGTQEAYTRVLREHDKGTLSTLLGIEVVAFYINYGALVEASSEVLDESAAGIIETGNLVIWPTNKSVPPLMKGVSMRDDNPLRFHFIVDPGELSQEEMVRRDEYSKQVDYFSAALAVSENNLWVNLSAYEADRMLPAPLGGTQLGRDMLAQDVVLKQLTASFMHPDNPVGSQYWNAVHARSREIYGTSRVTLNSFQKVWIVPKKAVVYEMPADGSQAEIRERFHVEEGSRFAYVCETDLETLCEYDFVAFQHRADSRPGLAVAPASDFTLEIFKSIVLPHIRREVNEGEHFCALRQIYHTLILATWFKKKVLSHEAYRDLIGRVDSNDATKVQSTIFNVQNIGSRKDVAWKTRTTAAEYSRNGAVDHATPDAPAFRIADNVEFYNRYIRLFRDGVFKSVRTESGDQPGETISRVYFSGAIEFHDIPLTVRTV